MKLTFMRIRMMLAITLLLPAFAVRAQTHGIRVADTLTAAERAARNPILLRSELDSLVRLTIAAMPRQEPQIVTVPAETGGDQWVIKGGLLLIVLLLGGMGYLDWRHKQMLGVLLERMNEKEKNELATDEPAPGKTKQTARNPEQRIGALQAELTKLSKENEGLNRVIKEYNGIQQDLNRLRHGIHQAYKVKNYPGYHAAKEETNAIQGVLQTEKEVALYAYEKLLKPVLAVVDANKNDPAKISETDQQKLLDGLLSLSLLYIEYLYLRVNELAIGGKMVQRIQEVGKGAAPDTRLLRILDTERGSRALVIRMLLDKLPLQRLSYPVFDETNLNPQ